MPPGGQPPGGPPRPPRNTGIVAAIVVGALAVIAIVALGVTLLVVNAGTNGGPVAQESTATSARTGGSPDTPDNGVGGLPTSPGSSSMPDGDPTTAYALADAMKRYIDAGNARDVNRMRAAVCSAARSTVQAPTGRGTLVLDQLAVVSVDADVAQSRIQTHTELGSQRSSDQQNDVSFQRENSTWYYCPGAEPAISA